MTFRYRASRVRKNTECIFMYVLGMFLILHAGIGYCAEKIQDPDFQFILSNPGPGWTLLPEQKAQQLVPDAIAGAFKQPEFFSMIIVEHIPSMSLEDYVDLVVGGIPIEEKQIKSRQPDAFLGHAAIRSSISGNIQGIPLRYFITIIQRGEWFYQLLGWGLEQHSDTNKNAYNSFVSSISFTEGKIQARTRLKESRSASGVGWLLTSGRYQNAAYGFEISPPDDWRIAVGEELKTMSTDAVIGLIRSNPDIYMTIIPERLMDIDKAGYSQQFYEQIKAEYLASSAPIKKDIKIFNQDVTMYLFKGSNQAPFDYLSGIVWSGDAAYKILAWYSMHNQKTASMDIERALSSLKVLNNAERKNLALRLKSEGDTQNIVGLDYSLRNGIYRDFSNYFVWKKPSGYWRLETGSEARNRNKDATLFLNELSMDVYGLVISEDVDELDFKKYHKIVKDNLWSSDDNSVQLQESDIDIDGQPGLLTEGLLLVDGARLIYSLATVKNGKRAMQILFWGNPGNMKKFSKLHKEAIEAFEFLDDGFKPVRIEKNVLVDERLGFQLKKPGSEWKLKDETPEALESVGKLIGWHKGNAFLQLVAICALGEEHDPNLMIEYMVNNIITKLDNSGKTKPNKKPITFKGRSAVYVDVPSSMNFKAVLFSRDRTAYAVLAAGKRQNRLDVNDMERLVNLIE